MVGGDTYNNGGYNNGVVNNNNNNSRHSVPSTPRSYNSSYSTPRSTSPTRDQYSSSKKYNQYNHHNMTIILHRLPQQQ
jgi:hypothetical protein